MWVIFEPEGFVVLMYDKVRPCEWEGPDLLQKYLVGLTDIFTNNINRTRVHQN